MKIMPIVLAVLLAVSLSACTPDLGEPSSWPPVENPEEGDDPGNPPQASRKMKITIGSAAFSATLADNAAATAFRAMLPMTITMNEMNGNEKYYYLPDNLPIAPSNPGTIRNGDIMLYGSSALVLFYKAFSTPYGYTPLGRADDPSRLEAALGRGSVAVKFELANE